jgi:SulP family sulfate permease
VLSFFPRHILIGCIAGVGFFLFLTGFTLSLQQEVSDVAFLFELENLQLWGTSFGIAVFLLIISYKFKHQLLVPLFYTILPVVFYACALPFLSFDELRSEGWLFKLSSVSNLPTEYWTYFDFGAVNIHAIIVFATLFNLGLPSDNHLALFLWITSRTYQSTRSID